MAIRNWLKFLQRAKGPTLPVSEELRKRVKKQDRWNWILIPPCYIWIFLVVWSEASFKTFGPPLSIILIFFPLWTAIFYSGSRARILGRRLKEHGFDWLDTDSENTLYSVYQHHWGKLRLPYASDFDTIPGDGNRLDKLVFLIDELNRPRKEPGQSE